MTDESTPPESIQPDELIDRKVGDYKIIQRIGESLVFLAFKDDEPEVQMALKFFYPNAYVVDHHQLIMDRLQPLCKLEHDNIVKIHEVGEIQNVIYVAMEYVRGENLYELMLREPRLHWGAAAEIAREITKGLVAAHAVDVPHLSLHPDRILLGRGGQIKVNFCNEGVITPSAEIVHFVPPELFLGQPLGKSSDVYSLGAIIYNIVTGKPPVAGKLPREVAQKHRQLAPVLPSYGVADVPHALSLILERSLNKEITKRYENCFELLAALNNFLSNDIGSQHVYYKTPDGARNVSISYKGDQKYRLGDYKKVFKILESKSHRTFTQAIKLAQEEKGKRQEDTERRLKEILPTPETSTQKLKTTRSKPLYRINRFLTRRFGGDYGKMFVACAMSLIANIAVMTILLLR